MQRREVPDARLDAVVETMFDFVVAGALMIWALSIGVLPTHQVYSRIPTVDWKFFLRHETATAIGLAVLALALRRARVLGRAAASRTSGRACGSASRSSATAAGSCSA